MLAISSAQGKGQADGGAGPRWTVVSRHCETSPQSGGPATVLRRGRLATITGKPCLASAGGVVTHGVLVLSDGMAMMARPG